MLCLLVSLAAAQDNINIENRCGPRNTTTCEPRCAHGVQNGTPGGNPRGESVAGKCPFSPQPALGNYKRAGEKQRCRIRLRRRVARCNYESIPSLSGEGSTEQLHLEAHVAPHVSLHTLRQSGGTFTSRFRLCVVTADDVVFVFARSRYDSID